MAFKVIVISLLITCVSYTHGSNQILLQSEGDAAEWQGSALGFFDLDESQKFGGRPVYKQKGGPFGMFYLKKNGWWVVGKKVNNKWTYHLGIKSTTSLPPTTGWKYYRNGNRNGKSLKDDRTLKLQHNPRSVNSCNKVKFSVRFNAGVYQGKRSGLYSWTGGWNNGRKIYSKGDDYLYVPTNQSGWGIAKKGESDFGIGGGRATTCPCTAGASRRKGWNGWRYKEDFGLIQGGWETDRFNNIEVSCS